MSDDPKTCSSPRTRSQLSSLKNQSFRFGLQRKSCLNFASHLLLPLTMGIFTVTFTVYQQRISNDQRLEDRNSVREQREQDMNISAFQREQDLNISTLRRELDMNMSALQREQDRLIARLQREEDELRRSQDLNISLMQRDLNLRIAEMKQVSDNINAEKQRNMSHEQRSHEIELEQSRHFDVLSQRKHELELEERRHIDTLVQRKHELDIERNRYLDSLVLSYINDVSSILRSINESFISKRVIEAALVRAKTLNVLGQLDSDRALQIIQFLYNAGQLTVKNNPLDLTGAHLNALNLKSSPRMPTMKKVSLRQTFLINASFEGQDVSFWDFSGAQLTNASFVRANCTRTIFEYSVLVGTDFSQSILTLVEFTYVNLYGATFYQTKPTKFIFNHAILDKVNFTGVSFLGGDKKPASTRFSQSSIAYSIFVRAILFNIRFELCNLTGSDFSNSYLVESEFYANIFTFALLINTNMSITNWYFSDMSYTNMSGADCTFSCDLDEPLSCLNATLPNNTFGNAPEPLVRNGRPDCLKRNTTGWTVRLGSVTVQSHPYEEDAQNGKCVFAPLNIEIQMISVSMSQWIDVSSFVDLTSEEFSLLTIRTRIGIKTLIHITQYNEYSILLSGSDWRMMGGAEKTDSIVKEMLLNRDTYYIKIEIEFSVYYSITYLWVEYIELEIKPFYHPLDRSIA